MYARRVMTERKASVYLRDRTRMASLAGGANNLSKTSYILKLIQLDEVRL